MDEIAAGWDPVLGPVYPGMMCVSVSVCVCVTRGQRGRLVHTLSLPQGFELDMEAVLEDGGNN